MRITTTDQATPPGAAGKEGARAEVELREITDASGDLVLTACVRLAFPMPAHDERLVDRLEQAIEDGGQQVKRQLFVYALEYADRQLVLDHRGGKAGRGGAPAGGRPSAPCA